MLTKITAELKHATRKMKKSLMENFIFRAVTVSLQISWLIGCIQ